VVALAGSVVARWSFAAGWGRATVAVAALAVASLAIAGRADAAIDTDMVRLTDSRIDFGDNSWVAGAPIGFGSVLWDIVSGFYTPRLIDTLHLDGASGKYARIHVSYWDGGGGYIDTRHGGVRAPDNQHYRWSVDLSPLNLMQLTEAHICTEISDDGVNFSLVDCITKYLY
jgi:hypothetical protein